MNSLLSDRLQKWLRHHGIKKTELAAALRIRDSQVITNWIGRGSIPKQYVDQIRALVNSENWDAGCRAMRDAHHISAIIKTSGGRPSEPDSESIESTHHPRQMTEESAQELIGEIQRYLATLPKSTQRKLICAAMDETPLDQALTHLEHCFHWGLKTARKGHNR